MYGSLLGYRKGEDDEPEIIPKEAETVRRIYREFLAGKVWRKLKRDWRPMESGVPEEN